MLAEGFKPKNLNAQTVDYLGSKIVGGDYSEGEKLPIEAELCESLGVSRPIVREATKILEAKGLLSSRPKRGTLVEPKSSWNLLDKDVLRWMTQSLSEEAFLDLMFDVRRAIEPAAAELAAEHSTEAQIQAISQAFDEMAQAQTVDATIEPDIRFHQSILEASGNAVLRYIGNTLNGAMAASMRLTTANIDQFKKTALPPHEDILRAIQARNPKKAGDAVRYLLDFSRNSFNG